MQREELLARTEFQNNRLESFAPKPGQSSVVNAIAVGCGGTPVANVVVEHLAGVKKKRLEMPLLGGSAQNAAAAARRMESGRVTNNPEPTALNVNGGCTSEGIAESQRVLPQNVAVQDPFELQDELLESSPMSQAAKKMVVQHDALVLNGMTIAASMPKPSPEVGERSETECASETPPSVKTTNAAAEEESELNPLLAHRLSDGEAFA